ncbi:ParB/RepB/Spo0J family partition protein [Tardiphaga robiniae]|uniref:ParB N-terminal domain-containing protein n=1 Tax=Tardiphaga robiniae TaxID=943830 RepID=A0A7G6U582_9BRAD|nr:ParB/RepB/Spo0J family partition protein [Tardiphaga robiniae]QND74164.1 ParB N-terminal domain-containing protein [Tardiphaga robiniae]
MTEQNTQGTASVAQQEPARVKIADIAIRDDWQVRNKIDDATVNTYKNIYKNGGTGSGNLPPVKLAQVDGTLRLVDGWHRLRALDLLGESTVEAIIFSATMWEAQYAAATANMAHGLPLKPSEVRKVFNVYVTTRQHIMPTGRIKSYRAMEEDLNHRVSYRTLHNWMKKDHPKVASKMAEQYGDEDKARFHDGGPPPPDTISALSAAIANLDQALAEARSMSPQERGHLIAHAKGIIAGIEGAGPWSMSEANTDF